MLEALEPNRSQLSQFEDLPQATPRSIGEHHGSRAGHLLQPRREVRGLANNRLLLRCALADQVPDNHEAGCNSDPRRKWLARGFADRDTAALMRIREDELGIQVRPAAEPLKRAS
jgi:hypothetical protein